MEGVLEQLEVLTNALLDEREQRERLTVSDVVWEADSELCGRLAVMLSGRLAVMLSGRLAVMLCGLAVNCMGHGRQSSLYVCVRSGGVSGGAGCDGDVGCGPAGDHLSSGGSTERCPCEEGR